MSEKRFFINGNMVIDGENIIPSTMWQFEEQQKKYCDELNKFYEEKKQLKQKIISLEDARYSYKQDWKQASADCELYKEEIKFLKD